MNPRWITVSEVARRLCISVPTARKRLRDGTVQGLVGHVGSQRVERETFEKWEVSQRSGKK